MGVVAPKILHEDMAGVGFRREAVVSNVHASIGYTKAIHNQCIEAIRVGRVTRGIGRVGMNENVIERNIIGANKKVGPAGRVQLRDSFHTDTRSILCQKENRSIESVVRVLQRSGLVKLFNLRAAFTPYQNLTARELVVPFLPITIECSLAKDLDIVSTPSPKRDRLLE